MTSVQEPSAYEGFRGKRLALVESMLHAVFYDEIAAARRHGLRVHLLIRDREWYAADEAAWRDHPLTEVDQLTFVDTHSADAVLEAITDEHGRPLVDGITTFSDYHTEIAAQVAEKLGLPSPGANAIATANHKPSLRAALGDSPYNVPYALVTHPGELAEAAARIGYPLVLKPPAEAISYGVVLVDHPAELTAAYDRVAAIRQSLRGQPRPGHVLMERYIDAPEVSVESLTVDGVTHVYGVTAKYLCPPPTFLEAAHTFPATLDPVSRAEVETAVTEVLRVIGYRQGPCHTEVKCTADGPKIVEVNPRLPAGCLTTMVRDVCGSNPHLDAKLLAVGARPPLPSGRQSGGAAVVMLYPPPGPAVLEAVDGVTEAEELPGVSVSLFAHPGEHLWHRIDNSGRVGLVYATAATPQDALDTATRAAGRVRITVAPADAGPDDLHTDISRQQR
ncbi:ATP-grasp domain-containing protein [Kitasatospora sp. NPDC052896]|uniref:ATP-grasp domain-containing protein n=1 Tax=Kitasatospora sp. NPDC052896 TaxID=3364061 RepID=UPI0037C6F690